LKEKYALLTRGREMKRQEKSITLSAHFLTHSPCLILNPTSIHSAAEFNSAAQWAIIIIYGCPRTAAGIYCWLTEKALEWVRAYVSSLALFQGEDAPRCICSADAVSILIGIRVCEKYCNNGIKAQHFHKNQLNVILGSKKGIVTFLN
jgi:hypothetical protein